MCVFFIVEGGNFRNILDKAVCADQVVKERYNNHCEMIALLCKPENELCSAIPSANPAKTLQGSEVKDTLFADATKLKATQHSAISSSHGMLKVFICRNPLCII